MLWPLDVADLTWTNSSRPLTEIRKYRTKINNGRQIGSFSVRLTWVRIQGWTKLVAGAIFVQSVLSRTTQQGRTVVYFNPSFVALNQDAGQSERMSRVRIRFKTRDQQQKMSFYLDQDVFFNSETFRDFDKKKWSSTNLWLRSFQAPFLSRRWKKTFGAILVFFL